MSVITALEGLSLSSDGWVKLLGVGKPVFETLCNQLIFRRDEKGWRLALVGIIVFQDRVLLSRPKFDVGARYDLVAVLKLLNVYFARSEVRRPHTQDEQNPEFYAPDVLREFDIAMALRQWYAEFGIYRREVATRTDAGRIDWTRTMARKDPLIAGGSVIYPSAIGSKMSSALNDVSDLQRSLTAKLCQRYSLPISGALADGFVSASAEVDLWAEPHRSYFMRRLLSEQQRVYRSDTLRLFHLMTSALDQGRSNDGRPQIYGTTAFYAVWEDACRTQFANSYQNAATMSQPTWFLPDGRVERHEQIPDLIVQTSDATFIVDAKYYYPFPRSRPGAHDIVKQMSYEDSLDYKQKRSIFILPTIGAVPAQYLGYSTIPSTTRTFPRIEAWGVDPYSLLAGYPSYSRRYADSFFFSVNSAAIRAKSAV